MAMIVMVGMAMMMFLQFSLHGIPDDDNDDGDGDVDVDDVDDGDVSTVQFAWYR